MTDMSNAFARARGPRLDAWVRAAPFVLFMILLAARSTLGDGALERFGAANLDVRWLYAVQAALAAGALIYWRRRYGELMSPAVLASGTLVSLGAGVAVFLLWIAPMPEWMHVGSGTVAFVPVDERGELRWDLIAARMIGAVLVVPVMEELFWRSFLLRWIDRRDFLALSPAQVSGYALLLSSAAFASAHDLWFAALVAGLVYAGLYRRYGNLWYPIIAHATTNFLLAIWVLDRRAWSYW
jgi:uncharacterized protein